MNAAQRWFAGWKSFLTAFAVGFGFIPLRAQPINDNFSNRTVLIGTSNVFPVSTGGGTFEPGEPNLKYMSSYPSVWYTWTAPSNGTVDLSYSDGYPSYFSVYHGDNLKSLKSAGPLRPREFLHLDTKPGETFQIQFMAPQSPILKMHLMFMPRPPNDNFTNRFLLEGLSLATNGSTHAATRQPGEPRHNMATFGRSVWYSWIAPASGSVTLELDSDYQLIAVGYTGKSVMKLRPVPWIITSLGRPFRETFFANQGIEYLIAVDGVPNYDRVVWDGPFNLKLDFTGLTLLAPTNAMEFSSPPEISLQAAGTLPDLDGALGPITFSAVNLVDYHQFVLGQADSSGVFHWTNPPFGNYIVQASSTDTNNRALFSNAAEIAFAVYTGRPRSLKIVQPPTRSEGEFDAIEGRTYQILVADLYPPSAPSHGSMTLTLQSP